MKVQRIIGFICLFIFTVYLNSCSAPTIKVETADEESFTFVFMTDIHLQPEKNAVEGFNQAIDTINNLNPDFVITGGDLVMDVLSQDFKRSEMLFDLYKKSQNRLNMPVYNTIGNHEIFGIYEESGIRNDHPEYGEKMFEKRIGERYYSFDHKGWHFMILDGIEDTGESSYIGKIDSLQMNWIKSDLEKLNSETPIVVSVHIPFITSVTQLEKGALEPNRKTTVITNSKEVLKLFDPYNLKLVLQGHLHFLEDIYAKGTHFVTGGAVSAAWWSGAHNGMEEGFLLLKVNGKHFEWEYVDFCWEADKE